LSLDILVTNTDPQRRVLIVEHDSEETNSLKNIILDHKFDFTPSVYVACDIAEAVNLAGQFHPDCVIAYGDAGKEFFHQLEKTGIDSARILICRTPDFEAIKDAINRCGVFRIIFKPWTEEEVTSTITAAIEYIDISRTNSALVAKVEARNQYLVKLKETLEDKGSEQKADLKNSTFTVKGINIEFEIMNRILNSLHGIKDVEHIENGISKILHEYMGINKVTIKLSDKSGCTVSSPEVTLSLPLFCSGCSLGEMRFQRDGFFHGHEIDFLEKVTDAVAMAVEKIIRFHALEKIKKQWESSFDSIDDPIVIIDDRFNILRANKAFAETSQMDLKDIAGRKCYDVFQTDKTNIPCSGCNIRHVFDTEQPMGSEVTAQQDKRFYTTWSYPIKGPDRTISAVHFYKDISDQVSYKERLVYSEKLAEIGILAGSVAHEINNPIGGMIALLQILISENNDQHPYYNDLKEMERAAQRCKSIVDNLLHFSRTSSDDEIRMVEFSSVFKTLKPLMQIQVKHEDIKVNIDADGAGLFVHAVFNELVQALLNIVNTSVELISKRTGSGYINMSVKKDGAMLLLEASDNGIPVNTVGTGFGSLALFVTEKIVKGYKGASSFENVNGENRYRLYFPLSETATSDIHLPENAAATL